MAKEITPKEKTGFSREYLFQQSKVKGIALELFFKVGSKANMLYGEYIVASMEYDDIELEAMINHYRDGVNTSGIVRAKILVSTGDIIKGQIVTFHTGDIFEIMSTRV